MVNKFKNTKLYLKNSFSKKLIKLITHEINRSRGRKRGSSPINYTGKLAESLTSHIETSSNGFSLNIEGLEYGKYVDEGGGAGAIPPVQTIVNWIRNKPVTSLQDYKGNSVKIDEIAKVQSIAYAISRAISLKGVQPTGFLDDAIENAVDELEAIADPLVQDIILNLEDIMLKAGYIKKGDNYILNNGTK